MKGATKRSRAALRPVRTPRQADTEEAVTDPAADLSSQRRARHTHLCKIYPQGDKFSWPKALPSHCCPSVKIWWQLSVQLWLPPLAPDAILKVTMDTWRWSVVKGCEGCWLKTLTVPFTVWVTTPWASDWSQLNWKNDSCLTRVIGEWFYANGPAHRGCSINVSSLALISGKFHVSSNPCNPLREAVRHPHIKGQRNRNW